MTKLLGLSSWIEMNIISLRLILGLNPNSNLVIKFIKIYA